MQTKWSGVYPALTTKFNQENDSLDMETMARHIEAQLDAGVHGLIMAGSLGESSVLTAAEKIDILKLALSTSKGLVPVLLTVAETTTADACALVEQCAAAGADGFMVLPCPEFFTPYSQQTLHFTRTTLLENRPAIELMTSLHHKLLWYINAVDIHFPLDFEFFKVGMKDFLECSPFVELMVVFHTGGFHDPKRKSTGGKVSTGT